MNAVEIEQAISDLCATEFDAVEFPFQFLEAFGEKATTIKRLRPGKNSTNKSDLTGGLLQRNNIHLLVSAPGQVNADLERLTSSPETTKQKAKFALATDGEFVEAENLVDGETLACTFEELPYKFGFFLVLAGIATVKQIRDNAFDIKATGRMNRLYVELQKNNPDWDTDGRREELNHFFARLIFCFFAEDTGIFPQDDLFTGTVQQMSDSDGSNTHEVIGQIFRAMNIPRDERDEAGLPPYAANMPYVNGGLFEGSTACPAFTKVARSYLIHIGGLDWTKINPDIFGSMIQAVAEDEERGELGMHYTSVPNILKVLNPLFLDELRKQLEDAGDSKRKLLNLRNRMARIRVFDPACGSGNFLVIAYKEMREIEAEINRRRAEADRASDIPLTNFRGIEIRSFAAEVARLALVIAQFQSDLDYRGRQLALSDALPLKKTNWITCGNALRLNWMDLCPPTETGTRISADDLYETPLDQPEIDFENEGGQTYICGNPPYLGSTWQSPQQKADLENLLSKKTKSWRSLDYVCGWLEKATRHFAMPQCKIAFVMTKTVCEGQHVPILWPFIHDRGFHICFAHEPMNWSNLATNQAGVTVVIVGLSIERDSQPVIISGPTGHSTEKRSVDNISPYLARGTDLVVHKTTAKADGRGDMTWGNKPVDGGNLTMSPTARRNALREYPQAKTWIKPFPGASEFIQATPRYCLWIPNDEVSESIKIPEIQARLTAVRTTREASGKKSTRELAEKPNLFAEIRQSGNETGIAIPCISSSEREYLPCGLVSKGTIISNKMFALFGQTIWPLSVLSSRLHRAWIATVCTRLRTDFSYSNTLGWNTFPLPELPNTSRESLRDCARSILLARESYWPATIADMYDPDRMDTEFPRLREAHDHNDEVLERIYIGRRFKNDTERIEKLFEMYAAATEKEASI